METIKFEVTVLIASEGNEIYNIADPTIYGKRITLAKSDTPENWAERPQTVVDDLQNDEIVTKSSSSSVKPLLKAVNTTADNAPTKTKIQRLFKRIFKWR